MEKDKLYTYDRLSQFVDNYTEFVKVKRRNKALLLHRITTTIISKHHPMQLIVTPWADLVHQFLKIWILYGNQ